MDNDERIRKWREKRGEQALDEPVFPTPGSPRIAPRSERPLDPASSSDGLDEARNQVLVRRRERWRLFMRRIGLFLALPLLIVFLYIELVATPLYQGEAVFTVQTSGDSAASPNAGLFALGGGGSTIADAFKAREFILSRPMMDYMQKRYGFAPLGSATGAVKTAIFTENNARLYNIDAQTRAAVMNDHLAKLRMAYEESGRNPSNLRYGYVRR